MKPFSTFRLVGCILVAVAAPCSAGQSQYECVVRTANKLTAEGALVSHWSLKSQIGQKFTVDRETGQVIGGPLDNSRLKIQLIDKGSGEMSFQVFAQSNQKTHTNYLQVEEFQSAEQKPFVGATTLYYPGVYSGTCK
jgi:hypothetical protein